MKLKNIFIACLAGIAFTSCSNDEEAFYTVSENDAPRILNTDFPDGGFSINRNENLKFEVLVTPTDYTTVRWLADNKEVFVGNNIDQAFEAGDYTLKIVATTTKGKETSRTMKLNVKAVDGDPQAADDPDNRVVKPGANAQLHGTNIANIKKVAINGQLLDATYDSTNGCLVYTIPSDIPAGTYRISLIDEAGQSFGAGKIIIVSKPTVSKASFAGTSNGSLTIEGYYMNYVATITIDGKECAITEKNESQLTFTTPELEVGDYELKGTTTSGEPVLFINNGQLDEVALFMVSAEKIIWMGDFTVDWDGPEDHKEWRQISQEEFATFEVGHILTVSLKLVGTDYHKYQIDNWDWSSLPGQSPTDFSEDTDVAIEITQDLKDAVAAKAFCIHGHGFSVVRVTYK
jgi:hypothetical protein